MQKLLFICSRNRRRSLTAERLFDGVPGFVARSAGTQPGARVVVTAGHLGWADVIFCMEKSHVQRLRLKFGDALDGRTIVVLHLPDEFEFMEPALIDELRARLAPHVTLPAES